MDPCYRICPYPRSCPVNSENIISVWTRCNASMHRRRPIQRGLIVFSCCCFLPQGYAQRRVKCGLIRPCLCVGGLCHIPWFCTPCTPNGHSIHCVTREKGGREQSILIAPCTQLAINEWIKNQGKHMPTPRRFLFPGRRCPTELPLSTSFIKKRFSAIATRASPPVVGPHAHIHTTRHTVAVALRLAGRRMVDIQSFLGHRNVATTANIYSRPDADDLAMLLHLPWIPHRFEKKQGDALLESLTGSGQSSTSSLSLSTSSSRCEHDVRSSSDPQS